MKIIVSSSEHSIHLRLPTGLVFNRLTLLAIPKTLRKHGITVTYKQAATFLKALNHYRRQHRDWNLVEADTSDGEHILVKL